MSRFLKLVNKRMIVTMVILSMMAVLLGACGNSLSIDIEESTEAVSDDTSNQNEQSVTDTEESDQVEYKFRNDKLLTQHYEKHGEEMGFPSKEAYEKAASDVINNKAALTKTEAEDGDMCYYVEETNEFVVLSTDGYIRTYFNPDAGKRYFDKQ